MHWTDKMFLIITKEAIIMLIPFFVPVKSFVHPGQIAFQMRQDSLQSVWQWHSHPLSHSSPLPFNPPPSRLSTHSGTYLLSSQPALIRLRVMELRRVCARSGPTPPRTRWSVPLTWFRWEDVSQLLDDLLELQYRVLFVLHVISCRTHAGSFNTSATCKGLSWARLTFSTSAWQRPASDFRHACRWPAASVSVVSLLAGSPWWPPPDTGEDSVDGSDPLASESSLGCFCKILIIIHPG